MKPKYFLLALLALLASSEVCAYDFYAGGIYYDISGSEATVTSKDVKYNSYSGVVTIPSTVTYNDVEYNVKSIGNYAFRDCSGLTSITIPNSVTSIGYDAFRDCSALTSVTIGSGVTSIDAYAFAGCSGLTSITIPNSVTSIGSYAFSGCSGLTSFTIPSRVTRIYDYTFYGCSELRSIIIPGQVTSLGRWTFYGCTSLTDVYCYATTPPEAYEEYDTGDDIEKYYAFDKSIIQSATLHVPLASIDSYGIYPWYSFGNRVKLKIDFADANVKALCVANWDTDGDGDLSEVEAAAVTELGEVFKDNTTITSFDELKYFTGLTVIGQNAFSNCDGLTSVVIPNNVTKICFGAFDGCVGLTSVIIPSSVTVIDDVAFRNCYSLTSVTVPNSVTAIYNWAFSHCVNLNSIIIPRSVNYINDNAFEGCYFIYDSFVNNSALSDNNNWGATLCDEERIDGLLIKNNSVVHCRDWATSVSIPNGVTSIGRAAFILCRMLTSVDIPDGVTSIGLSAFKQCYSLTSVSIPSSVSSIGQEVFYNCSDLTSVTIGNGVTSIGNAAFFGCSSLTSVNVLGETPSSIKSNTFPSTIAKIRVPEAAVSAYKAATNWSEFSAKIIALGGEDNSITVEEIEENKAAGGSANQTYIVTDEAADDVKAADNVIVHSGDNYTCANLVLSDGEPFETMAEEFTATAATYTRSVSVGNTSGTICVPYAFAKEDGVKYYTVDNTRSDDETIYLSEVAEDIIPAATPVIYIKGSGKTTMTFSGSNAVAKKTAGTGSGTFELRGTFEKTTITESDELAKSYALSGGKFLCSTTKLTINPFRAYLYNTGAVAGARLDLSVEDEEPTGITSENAALMSGDAEIEGYYTLDGKRVGSLQKGAVTVIRYANGKSVKVFAK